MNYLLGHYRRAVWVKSNHVRSFRSIDKVLIEVKLIHGSRHHREVETNPGQRFLNPSGGIKLFSNVTAELNFLFLTELVLSTLDRL